MLRPPCTRLATTMLLVAALAPACAMPKTPVYEPNEKIGEKLCSDIANHAQLVSTQEMGVGVFLLTIGGAAVTASGVLATVSANSTEHRELLGYVGAGLAVTPLVAVPFGMVLMSRSDEASALAAAANTSLALNDSDEDMYRDCVLAKAAWVGSRADATALARKALEDEKERIKDEDDAAAEEDERKMKRERSAPDDEAEDPKADEP